MSHKAGRLEPGRKRTLHGHCRPFLLWHLGGDTLSLSRIVLRVSLFQSLTYRVLHSPSFCHLLFSLLPFGLLNCLVWA